MSYYVFLHFKSDIVPHINSPPPPPLPSCSWSLSPFQPLTYFYLLTSSSRPLRISALLPSMVLCLFPFPLSLPCHCHDIFHTFNAFVFTGYLFLFSLLPSPTLLCPNATPLCQSLCVRGRCSGFRRPARCRRRSTKQGRGVRIRCSLGTDCTSCPGPPIAQTCCTSTPPGKTSNRASQPLTTSEGASHCPG